MKTHILIINHKHGSDVTAHATRDDLRATLAAHASQWWQREVGAVPLPSAEEDIIAQYFDVVADFETYESHDCEIAGPADVETLQQHLAIARGTLESLSSVLEGEWCDPAAYGMAIENPDHPFHEDMTQLRATLAQLNGETYCRGEGPARAAGYQVVTVPDDPGKFYWKTREAVAFTGADTIEAAWLAACEDAGISLA